MKTIVVAASLTFPCAFLTRGGPAPAQDAGLVATAQLAASSGLVGNAHRNYGYFRDMGKAPFLFVARSSYEFSVDWVVWIVGTDDRVEVGAFCPDLPPAEHWLGMFAEGGSARYERLRDFHQRAAALLAPSMAPTGADAMRGRRHAEFILGTGGDPSHHEYHGPASALDQHGGRVAALAIEIIRFLQQPGRDTGGNGNREDRQAGSPLRERMAKALSEHGQPRLETLKEGDACAVLTGEDGMFVEIADLAEENSFRVTIGNGKSLSIRTIPKNEAKAQAPQPSGRMREAFATCATVFERGLAPEANPEIGSGNKLLLVARKRDGKTMHLARCFNDGDLLETEMRRIFHILREIHEAPP